MSKQAVQDYHAALAENEWRRLSRPEGALEFAVTADDPTLLGASIHLLVVGHR